MSDRTVQPRLSLAGYERLRSDSDGEQRALRHIAVIAVHGVGHHEPKASARAMAEMLLRTPRESEPEFTSFREVDVQVPTRPLVPTARRKSTSASGRFRSFSERSAHPTSSDAKDPDYLLMSEQLSGYSAAEADGVYDTVRVEGRHFAGMPSGGTSLPNVDADVHIYEFYWSDISRVGPSLLSVFGAFYQLVIHLPYIGRSTVDFARAADGGKRAPLWTVLSGAHTWAMRALTLFVPTLNMLMLATGLVLLVRHVPQRLEPAVAIAFAALVSIALGAIAMYRSGVAWRGVFIAVPLGVAAGIVWLMIGRTNSTLWLLYEAWFTTAVGLVAVLSIFERNRPGAMPVGLLMLVVTFAGVILSTRAATGRLTSVILPVLEWQYFALCIAWIVFGGALVTVTIASGALAAAARLDRSTTPEERSKLNRAGYTARFALALPAVGFSVATLLVWGLLVTAEGSKPFDKAAYAPVFFYPALIAHVGRDTSQGMKAFGDTIHTCDIREHDTRRVRCEPAYFIRTFAGAMDTRYGFISTGACVLAILIILIGLVPVLATEMRSPRSPPTDSEARFKTRAVRLGLWLNFAFGAARISGELLVIACYVAFVGLLVAFPLPFELTSHFPRFARPTPSADTGIGFLTYGRLLLGGASTLSILAVIRFLSSAGSGLRPALGIAADVDNYLRELPRKRTPRARMAERYVSLLRYICGWRADSGDAASGYDAVVIVAHSQGTVITTDLLRYLRRESDAEPSWEPSLDRFRGHGKPLPIVLFTMGSPLRQLYAQRFPHLYAWTCGTHAVSDVGPEPSTLIGVEDRWLNAYRTGDYVGRALWGEPIAARKKYEFVGISEAASAGDACIGPGAHTHYWDETADWIALRLSGLIAAIADPALRK